MGDLIPDALNVLSPSEEQASVIRRKELQIEDTFENLLQSWTFQSKEEKDQAQRLNKRMPSWPTRGRGEESCCAQDHEAQDQRVIAKRGFVEDFTR